MTPPTPETLDTATRDTLVGAAILAPSMHNTQPWRFRFRANTVAVHRDPRYELAAEDPERRMAMISIGAVVFNLRVAAAKLGYEAAVELHDNTNRTLIAEVSLVRASSDQSNLAVLYPELAKRRTNRAPYSDEDIPAPVRTKLGKAAAAEGASLEWVTEQARRDWLLRLTGEANMSDDLDPLRLQERHHWVGGERDRDGVPSSSLGPRPRRRSAPVRDLAVNRGDRVRPTSEFENQPVLAVMATTHDSPRDWLVAGQALQHVLLVATQAGLAASLLTQAIEHRELRWLVRDPLGGRSEPQVVMRLGYGPEAPATPRRPIGEFVDPD
jgi:nitroreductase